MVAAFWLLTPASSARNAPRYAAGTTPGAIVTPVALECTARFSGGGMSHGEAPPGADEPDDSEIAREIRNRSEVMAWHTLFDLAGVV